jgi:hypothetical protein
MREEKNAVICDVTLYGYCKNRCIAFITRPNMPEDDILHSHRRENLKSYMALTGWAL